MPDALSLIEYALIAIAVTTVADCFTFYSGLLYAGLLYTELL